MPKLGHFAASGRFWLQQGYPSRVAESVYFHSFFSLFAAKSIFPMGNLQ
jgi:hypothetical protein